MRRNRSDGWSSGNIPPQGGCLLVLLLLIGLGIFISCGGPKTYEFQYSVDVRYTDNSVETLVGTYATTVYDPKKVRFALSSRFRKEPCLLLGEIGLGTAIACGVKSFNVSVLKYAVIK